MSCLSVFSRNNLCCAGQNIVSSVVFSLADRTLEKATLDSGKLDLGLKFYKVYSRTSGYEVDDTNSIN